MKDIDFDELDRAVSSVLGQTAAVKADEPAVAVVDQESQVQETVADTTPASDNDEPSDNNEPTVTAEESPVAKPATPPLAIRRRGKFMDVMHPSADMKPGSALRPKAPRQAPVITPLVADKTESSVEHTSEPTAALDESHSLIGAEPAPVSSDLVDDTSAAASGPDPSNELSANEASLTDASNRDLTTDSQSSTAGTIDTEAAATVEETEVALADTSTPGSGENDTDNSPAHDAAPQSTPFLTDTQVEKRPLGAFGETETPSTDAGDDASSEATPGAEKVAPALSLPRELQPDVVGVESVQENEAIEVPDTAGSPFAAKVAVAPDANDGRVEGHPLFDTTTYHEPIAAVRSGSLPGWAKWLIGLLLCLAVGAGVGYFLFTAGL